MRYQQAVFDTMTPGLRLGDRPRVLIATTPKTTPSMKRLVAMDDIRITSSSTYDNADHLSPAFLTRSGSFTKTRDSVARNCKAR